VKQKRQASADFLGVLTVSRNVVDGCCIPTTTLVVPVSDERHMEPQKVANPAAIHKPHESNGLSRDILTMASRKRPQRWTLRPFERSFWSAAG
jgi:hypothetical protein